MIATTPAPQSMESGIDLLTKCDAKRTVCILGDMGELGGEAPLLHRHVGEHAAKCGVGLLVAIGSLSENMYSGCLQNGGNCLYFKTKEEFLEKLEGVLLPGDVTLLRRRISWIFRKLLKLCKNKMFKNPSKADIIRFWRDFL